MNHIVLLAAVASTGCAVSPRSTPGPHNAPARVRVVRCPRSTRRLTPTLIMPTEGEAGERLIVEGTVYRPDGKTPAAGVLMYTYHTNAGGVYAKRGNETGNGRRHGYLRGWLRTGPDGKYRIETIKPGSYPSRSEPAHVHMTLQPPGEPERYIDDVVFEGDPLLTAAHRARLQQRGGSGSCRWCAAPTVSSGPPATSSSAGSEAPARAPRCAADPAGGVRRGRRSSAAPISTIRSSFPRRSCRRTCRFRRTSTPFCGARVTTAIPTRLAGRSTRGWRRHPGWLPATCGWGAPTSTFRHGAPIRSGSRRHASDSAVSAAICGRGSCRPARTCSCTGKRGCCRPRWSGSVSGPAKPGSDWNGRCRPRRVYLAFTRPSLAWIMAATPCNRSAVSRARTEAWRDDRLSSGSLMIQRCIRFIRPACPSRNEASVGSSSPAAPSRARRRPASSWGIWARMTRHCCDSSGGGVPPAGEGSTRPAPEPPFPSSRLPLGYSSCWVLAHRRPCCQARGAVD